MSTLVLVRHGQAMFLSENYDQLSELGERQSTILGEYWAREGESFTAFYTGPLERQKGTAYCVHEVLEDAGHPLAKPTVMEEFNEYPGITMTKRLLPRVIEERPELAEMLQTPPGADPREIKKRFQKVFEVLPADEVR